MDEFQNSVMIALLPTTREWCKIELPHMTLVYCGEIPDLKAYDQNEMAKEALELALTCETMRLVVMGVDVFGGGDDPQVEVLTLRPDPAVTAMQSQLQHWSKSQHDFNPHVTVGPIGSTGTDIPDTITFDRIAVGWGDSLLTYNLQ